MIRHGSGQITRANASRSLRLARVRGRSAISGLPTWAPRLQITLASRSAVREGENKFRAVLQTIVTDVAKQRGIDVVVPVNRSIYAIAELNLTDEVLQRINGELAEISLEFKEN